MATKTEETTKALTIAQEYPVLAMSNEFSEQISEITGGEPLSLRDLVRVKVPSGGARQWDLGETSANEVEGIVLYTKLVRAYWAERLGDGGGGNPPDCSSTDNVHGEGTPGGICARCPLSKYGSAENGRAQACKQTRIIFLARKGSLFPTLLVVPPSSLTVTKNYFLGLLDRAIPYSGVVSSFSLQKVENKTGIAYSEIVPKIVRALEPDEVAETRAQIESLKPLFTQIVQDVSSDRGEIDPEYAQDDLATRTGHAQWTPTECANGQHSEFGYYDQNGALHCDRCKAIIEEPAAEQAPLV